MTERLARREYSAYTYGVGTRHGGLALGAKQGVVVGLYRAALQVAAMIAMLICSRM